VAFSDSETPGCPVVRLSDSGSAFTRQNRIRYRCRAGSTNSLRPCNTQRLSIRRASPRSRRSTRTAPLLLATEAGSLAARDWPRGLTGSENVDNLNGVSAEMYTG